MLGLPEHVRVCLIDLDGVLTKTAKVHAGHELHVEMQPRRATYTLTAGEPIELSHHGEPLTIAADSPQTRPIVRARSRTTPQQPAGRAPRRRRPQR